MKSRAIFLDRDGTLNEERNYLRTPEELALIPGTLDALRRLKAAGYRLIVLTNQSGIARGFLDETILARIHETLHGMLEELPDAYLHCPHHPDTKGPYGRVCDCRKPAGGMLARANQLYDLDLEQSWAIGDSARDLMMTRTLPVRGILVRSGKPWREQQEKLIAEGIDAPVVDDLRAAVDLICSQCS